MRLVTQYFLKENCVIRGQKFVTFLLKYRNFIAIGVEGICDKKTTILEINSGIQHPFRANPYLPAYTIVEINYLEYS